MKAIVSLISGCIFGVGLTLSQMTDPNKVIGFLDIFGSWDPTLAAVMVGALLTTWLGYRWTFKSTEPILDDSFQIPQKTQVDKQLILGSVLFGLGWGLSGYCPGPAVANIVINTSEATYFLTSMLIGFLISHLINKKKTAKPEP